MKVAREPQAPPASANEDSNLIESEGLPQSSKKCRPTAVDLSQRRTVPLPSTRPQDDLGPADQRQRSEACRKTLERLHRRQLGSANYHEDCLGAPSVSRNTQQGTEEYTTLQRCVLDVLPNTSMTCESPNEGNTLRKPILESPRGVGGTSVDGAEQRMSKGTCVRGTNDASEMTGEEKPGTGDAKPQLQIDSAPRAATPA